tara:strand:+ start:1060 stop:1287 length:228 start_codon:yes stop_codon:yes gene_type:complete
MPAMRKYPEYSDVQAQFIGEPAEKHLLASSAKLESIIGLPCDSIKDIVAHQVFYLMNGGAAKHGDQKIGKVMEDL